MKGHCLITGVIIGIVISAGFLVMLWAVDSSAWTLTAAMPTLSNSTNVTTVWEVNPWPLFVLIIFVVILIIHFIFATAPNPYKGEEK